MTREERWVIVGLAWLILFGCVAERWRRGAGAAGPPVDLPTTQAEPVGLGEEERAPGPPPPIELNRCDAAELERLPGIGPVRANRIVEWRERHGPFRSVRDLLRVPGLGPKTLARIDSLLVVVGGEGGAGAEEGSKGAAPEEADGSQSPR
ncbi:MAG: helix-hairpin-helix domain-containing protein [Candidatus Eisenbacteria bacterium]|nr:helix-hairpin-helix domain-containing protein [Candidatus Eisenbacteria bacterium]